MPAITFYYNQRLGLSPSRAITERMVSKHFGIIAALLNGSTNHESNAWLFDEEKVKKFLGLAADDELDPYEHAQFVDRALSENKERLGEFIRLGIRSTLPQDFEHEGDFAIDGTYIHSWENQKSKRRKLHFPPNSTVEEAERDAVRKPTQKERGASKRAGHTLVRRPAKPHHHPDPDASWWNKGTPPFADAGLGYLMSALTWVERDLGPNQKAPDVPYLIEHFAIHTARSNGAIVGAELVESLVSIHEKEDQAAGKPDRVRGDIFGDREYSARDYWLQRMHVAGFTPHFQLSAFQRGETGATAQGAIIVDGLPYSPGMPAHLRKDLDPQMFATKEDRAVCAAFFMQRAPYRIKASGGTRQPDGSIKGYCPASNQAKSAIACSNKPDSLLGRSHRIKIGTALPIITNNPKPIICVQSTATFDFDDLPYWQPHIPGTPEHLWSVQRRNIVESSFSRIKDESAQSLRRGQVRMMGIAKISLATLFYVMAANMTEVARWRLRKAGVYSLDQAREIKTRTPRRHTRNRMRAAANKDSNQQSRAATQLLQSLGIEIDLATGEIITFPPPTT